ncbi:MAG: hypothetical protein V1663_04200 [archaeon]
MYQTCMNPEEILNVILSYSSNSPPRTIENTGPHQGSRFVTYDLGERGNLTTDPLDTVSGHCCKLFTQDDIRSFLFMCPKDNVDRCGLLKAINSPK